MKHQWSRFKQEPSQFVQFGSIHEACASMVKSKFCWIKTNWTSRLHPYTYTSLLEHIGSIARPDSIEFESCSSRGHEIVSLISQFAHATLVDLIVVINLSFDSLKTMPYPLSFDRLKFHVEILFASTHMIHDAICLANTWFVLSIVCATWICA